jgi:hypothetical protein
MFNSRSGFHPEFGLFCPSPRRRRALRLATLSVATMLAIGATMGLAVARWPGGQGAATPAQPASEAATAPTLAPEARVQHEPCKADTDSLASFFLNSTCGKHVRHGGHAAGRVATVIIGRTDVAPEPVTPPPAAATAEPAKPSAASAEKAENAAAAEPTVPAKKPKPKAMALTAPNAPNTYAPGAYAPNAYAPPYGGTRSSPPQSGFGPFGQWPRW